MNNDEYNLLWLKQKSLSSICLWKSFNTSRLLLFENPWELTKETRKGIEEQSIRSNRNYSAILAMPSVAEMAE